jgi:hypothetical protein
LVSKISERQKENGKNKIGMHYNEPMQVINFIDRVNVKNFIKFQNSKINKKKLKKKSSTFSKNFNISKISKNIQKI